MAKKIFYFALIATLTTFNLTQVLFSQDTSVGKKGDHKSITINNDKLHSSATFKVNHLVFTKVPGKFNNVDAQVTLKDGMISMFKATAQTDSIDTGNKKRDSHLKNKDFFDKKKYPKITLKMISHTKKKMKAELMMHGVKKMVELDFSYGFSMTEKNMKKLGMSMSTTIDRKDFSVGKKYSNKVVSDKVMVELSFQFEIPAKKMMK